MMARVTESEPHQTRMGECPYLGVIDDEQTCLAYPSVWNYCHRAKPVAVANLEHQRTHCLTDDHCHCPVFLSKKEKPLPPELRSDQQKKSSRKKCILIELLLIVLIGAWIGWQYISGGTYPVFESSIFQYWRTSTAPVDLPLHTPTKAAIVETPTVMLPPTTITFPTLPPTQIVLPTNQEKCGYSLDAKIISGSKVFIIHRVLGGENQLLLANRYSTTIDAIEKVNNFLPSPLWADLVIVIPVETSDVQGLPVFEPHLVNENDISIDDLAQKLSTDPNDLRTYNNLDETCRFFSGWLLIPRTKVGP